MTPSLHNSDTLQCARHSAAFLSVYSPSQAWQQVMRAHADGLKNVIRGNSLY